MHVPPAPFMGKRQRSNGARIDSQAKVAVVAKTNGLICDEVELSMVRHEGLVFLDARGTGQNNSLVHTTTLELRALPPGDWFLIFDDGVGAVCNSLGNGEHLLLEDYMHRQLFATDDGELIVTDRAKEPPHNRFNLTHRLRSFESLEATIFAGPTLARHKINLYLMSWPRQSMRFYWSLNNLYRHCVMTCYQGVASKWVHESRGAWTRAWIARGFSEDHLVRTSQVTSSEVDASKAFLPHSAVSSFGIVSLLSRFSGSTTQQGGLRSETSRRAASCLLEGLIQSCRNARPASFTMRLLDRWAPAWPLSEPPAVAVHLVLTETGQLTLDELKPWCMADGSGGRLCQSWCRRLGLLSGGASKPWSLPLVKVLLLCAGNKHLESFENQLQWAVASWMDLCCMTVLRHGPPTALALSIRTEDLSEVIKDRSRLDRLLVSHVAAGKEATRGTHFLHITSDKANVGGIQLSSSFIVLGMSNQCIMCCPQVVRVVSVPAGSLTAQAKFSGGPRLVFRGWCILFCSCLLLKSIHHPFFATEGSGLTTGHQTTGMFSILLGGPRLSRPSSTRSKPTSPGTRLSQPKRSTFATACGSPSTSSPASAMDGGLAHDVARRPRNG